MDSVPGMRFRTDTRFISQGQVSEIYHYHNWIYPVLGDSIQVTAELLFLLYGVFQEDKFLLYVTS
jgi:hypothetical protein